MVATACWASAGVSSEPSQPSASRPTRRSPPGAEPPSQISSGLADSGSMLAPSTVKNSPWKDTLSVVSSRRRRVSDSSKTAARLLPGTGNRGRSAGWAGWRPNTGSTRAGASPARLASCLATSTGCRPGSTEIPLPALSRRVLARANAIPVNGSTDGEYTFSGSHSESTPSCSRRSTAAANWPGTPAGPRDTPILTFMTPYDHSAVVVLAGGLTPSDEEDGGVDARRRAEGVPGQDESRAHPVGAWCLRAVLAGVLHRHHRAPAVVTLARAPA